MIVMELAVYAFEPRVLSPRNIVNVLNQSSYLTINGETCVCERDPMTPLIAALVQIAREVAPTLET